MASMLGLCECDSWEAASARIETIPTQVYPLYLSAWQRTDTACIKLLAREYPGALYGALKYTLEFNKTAVVSLLRKCLAALERGNIATLIDLCGSSSPS